MEKVYQPIFAHFPSISRRCESVLSLPKSQLYNNALNAPSTATSTTVYATTTVLHNAPTAGTQKTDDIHHITMDQHRGSYVYGIRPRRARNRFFKHVGDYFSASRLSAAVSLDQLDFDEYDEVFIDI